MHPVKLPDLKDEVESMSWALDVSQGICLDRPVFVPIRVHPSQKDQYLPQWGKISFTGIPLGAECTTVISRHGQNHVEKVIEEFHDDIHFIFQEVKEGFHQKPESIYVH